MRSHGTRARTPRAYATSRRGGLTTTTASAALVCLGVLLTAGCGGGGDDGYVAVGAAGQSQPDGDGARSGPERPDDKVKMVPLPEAPGDEASADSGSGGPGGGPANGSGSGSASERAGGGGAASKGGSSGKGADGGSGSGGSPSPGGSGGSGGGGTGGGSSSPSPGGSTGTGGSSPSPGGSSGGGGQGGDSTPSGPAVLKVSEPERAKASDRWCEKVTVQFRNTGGSAVKKGTVTFGTHIIGSAGVDWATRTSTRALPVPLGAGEKKSKTWTVCVDRWRVPLGMHVETRDVKVSGWK